MFIKCNRSVCFHKQVTIFILKHQVPEYGEKAYLVSPQVSGVQCVKFSYHMIGSQIGLLKFIKIRVF